MAATEAKTIAGAVEHIAHVDQHNFEDGKSTLDQEQARQLAASYDPNSPEEKALRRKLDWRLVPCCWTLYLMAHVDRSNIGNARVGGLGDDFNLTSTRYSIIVLVFFISYLIGEVPSNMILSRVRPSRYISGLGITWGIIATCMGAAQNWKDLVAMRFLLGLAEAGLAPGCAFYLSSWYRRYELTTRYSWLYASVGMAGALSGLLAGVIIDNMDGLGGVAGWRWLFIIEGLITVGFGVLNIFIMPDYPTTTSSKFLTEDERIIACNRLAMDGIGLTQGAHGKTKGWDAIQMTVKDWRTWCLCLLFVLVTGSQTIHYFIPSLVKSFGFSSVEAQYYTIPAYGFATVTILVGCYLADRIRSIWPVLAGLSGFGFIFFIAVICVDHGMARYALSVFAFGSIYGCSPLVKTWISHVLPFPAEKRAIAIALINALGNGASIYGSWLWPKDDLPRYTMGFAVTTAWMGALCVCTVGFAFLFKKYPSVRPEHDEVMGAQLRHEREEQMRKGMA